MKTYDELSTFGKFLIWAGLFLCAIIAALSIVMIVIHNLKINNVI